MIFKYKTVFIIFILVLILKMYFKYLNTVKFTR